jgi:16S rRNA (guanine527-N7)-methyltransferase
MTTPEPSTAGMSALSDAAAELGIELTQQQLALFATYQADLLDWNRRMNLTAIVDPRDIAVKHFADSLACLRAFPAFPTSDGGLSLVDVGTGAGFPGLPLKIVRPEIDLALLEATRKKTTFLEHLVDRLGLPGVRVLTGRAEELGRDLSYRERFDVATSRAVAELPALVELCLPLVRIGGRLIAQKKAGIEAELNSAGRAVSILGGRLLPVQRYELPGLPEPRLLVIVEKVKATPAPYPRRPGIPEKRPL